MELTLARDWRKSLGHVFKTIAHDENGVRYFKEGNRWVTGQTSKKFQRWQSLLSNFRRSDWGDRVNPPFHVSGCACNQYLCGNCTPNCETMQDMVYELGGFPEEWSTDEGREHISRDERNEYRSAVETYG